MRASSKRGFLAVLIGLSLALSSLAFAPMAAAVSCASPTTSSITETSSGITRTYTRSIVTATSSCEWTVPAGVTSLDLLVVGAGGGGGGGVMFKGAGGGGGGGEVLEQTTSVTPSVVLALTIGQGGTAGRGGQVVNSEPYLTGGMAAAGDGGASSIVGTGVTVTARGGRGGGNGTKVDGEYTLSGAGGASGSGNLGGTQNWDGAGGGAGQGGIGSRGVDISGVGGDGGPGGSGISSTITGSTLWYGAGGGGGGSMVGFANLLGTGAAGGSGVGGHGNVNASGSLPTSGAVNSGSGGGGGALVQDTSSWPREAGDSRERVNGAAGAAGVVVIRYTSGPNLTGTTVSGTPQVGSQITATATSVTGSPTPTSSFQWQSSNTGTGSWSNITGATSSTYSLGSSNLDQYLRAEVTITNSSGSAVTYTSAIGPVTAETPSTPAPAPSSSSPEPSPAATPTPAATTPPAAASLPTVSVAPSARPVTVTPGGGIATVGGNPVDVVRSSEQRGSGFTMSGGGVTASAVPPPTGFSSGGTNVVTMSGYAPDSEVEAYLFSTPVSLGSLTVGADGVAKGTIAIPKSVPPGNHTLQFTGWTPRKDPVVLSAGITVKPQVKRLEQSVPFVAGSRLPSTEGRALITRVVADSAALVLPLRTLVTYSGSGTPTHVRLEKSRAKAVAVSLRANGLVGFIGVAKTEPRERTSRDSGAVLVTVTGRS